MAKHNKKRNVGLIHEQLVRYASEKIVAGEESKAEKVISILDRHFKEGSELYKEFRLFNALVHTRDHSKDIARRIILESKAACKQHNNSKLRSEKSLLIRSINYDLNSRGFYGKRIPEYKIFATVQALLNEWRGGDRLPPDEIVKYETVLEKWITREVKDQTMDRNSAADPLAFKIMAEKFNKKYASCLNSDQACLLEYKLLGNDAGIRHQIEKIKNLAEITLQNFYRSCNNEVLNGKKDLVENKIRSLEIASDDSTVTKALMLSSLIEEMEGGDE